MCRDEYRSYVPAIYDLKVAGAGREIIASKLSVISQHEMGVDLTMELCWEVAQKIMEV
jgi:hypothetical protein